VVLERPGLGAQLVDLLAAAIARAPGATLGRSNPRRAEASGAMDEATHRAIRGRACFPWLEAGCPEGQAVLHRPQAEAEAELGLDPGVDRAELERRRQPEPAQGA
jgi:hypothetical protein